MKSIARQSILTTISSYIGVLIGYFNVLWLMPYALNPDQIGIFRTIQDMALLFVPFAQLGIGNGITKFYPQVRVKKFEFLTLGLLMSFVGFILVTILFFFFRQYIVRAFAINSPEVIEFLSIVIFITLFSVLNSILEAFSRSYLKIAVPTFIREVLLRLFNGILIFTYFWGWLTFDQMMWGMASIYFMALIVLIGYMVQQKIFRLTNPFNIFPKGFLKEFLGYSFVTLLGTAGAILIMKIDSLMVTSMIGLDANAIYIIAFSIAIVIEMPRRAISQVVMPVIAEHFAKNEKSQINILYKNVAVHQLLICLLLFIGVWSNIDNLYYFVPNREIYEAGKWVVLWIGLGKVMDVLFSVNGEIIVYSRYYVFNITATILMSIAVVLFNLLLIPIYGIEGAAFASFLAMLFYNAIKYFYVKWRLDFDPFSWDIAKILVLGAVVYGIQYMIFITMEAGFLDIIIRSMLISVLFVGGVYLLKIAPKTQLDIIKKIKGLRP